MGRHDAVPGRAIPYVGQVRRPAQTSAPLHPAEIRRRNLIRPDEMPYDAETKSFGASTVCDSGDSPALFDEVLRRLDYDRGRAE